MTQKNFNSEFPVITKNIESDLIPVERKIAPNFESAKIMRKQEIPKPNEEHSLFGEHDYDNQHEISYFGPPRSDKKDEGKSKNLLLDSKTIQDITADSLKELEMKAMKESGASNHHRMNNIDEDVINEPMESPIIKNLESESSRSFFKSNNDETYDSKNLQKLNLGEGIGVVEFPKDNSMNEYGNSNVDKETYEGFRRIPDPITTTPESSTTIDYSVGRKPIQLGPIPATDKLEMCDPKKDCCPLLEFSGRKKRGCTVGYRINEHHQQEGCVPEDCRHKSPIGFRFYI